jgi:hypothetical protein
MNSLDATLDALKVVVELKAIPIPIPRINTPPKIAMVVKLSIGPRKPGVLEVLAVLSEYLRLIFTKKLGKWETSVASEQREGNDSLTLIGVAFHQVTPFG